MQIRLVDPLEGEDSHGLRRGNSHGSQQSHGALSRRLSKTISIRGDSWGNSQSGPSALSQPAKPSTGVTTTTLGNSVILTEERLVSQDNLSQICDGSVSPPTGSESMFEFIVQDNGPGIRPDMQEKIFEPFVQGDLRLSRKYGGTGLGLS